MYHLTEEFIQRRAKQLAEKITDEELDELGMNRTYFRDMLISFGQSYGKSATKLDMTEIANRYSELKPSS